MLFASRPLHVKHAFVHADNGKCPALSALSCHPWHRQTQLVIKSCDSSQVATLDCVTRCESKETGAPAETAQKVQLKQWAFQNQCWWLGLASGGHEIACGDGCDS